MSLSQEMVEAIRGPRGTERFFRASVVQDERTGGLGHLSPSSTQRPVIRALEQNNAWLLVCKPRQSMTSTACLAWLLSQCEYNPGWNGLLITNKTDTSTELFDRLLTMHRHQPEEIQVPVRNSGYHGISFRHGGKIKVSTASGEDPAIGFSIDRLMGSEFGSWPDPELLSRLIPVVAKRPHARVVIESTPGSFGSAYHDLWLSTLAGETRFRPQMIRWWQHGAYARAVPAGFQPDSTEIRLLEKHVGMTHGHLQFRREMLSTACRSDVRLFENQYPQDELSGWTTTGSPSLPAEHILSLMPGRPDPPYLTGWSPYNRSHKYLLCADPNSYGSSGDPSAYTLWDGTSREEVGSFSGRVDPVKFASDLVKLSRVYGDALLVVESNAAACITAATNLGYRNIFYTSSNQDHPGWYRTVQAKERATTALVEALQRGQFRVRSASGLAQLMGYDGSGKRKDGHHWDRYCAYQMAADVMATSRFPASPHLTPLPPGQYNLLQMKRDLERRNA
jgi:hypothetical protein